MDMEGERIEGGSVVHTAVQSLSSIRYMWAGRRELHCIIFFFFSVVVNPNLSHLAM
jgi:hypothetical protein